MRLIGQLQDQAQANRFSDYLYAQGIESRVDPGRDGSWEIWVFDDNQLERASELLSRFTPAPDDPSFAQAAGEGARQRQKDEKQAVPRRVRVVDARTLSYQPPVGHGFLAIVLIAISVLVTVLSYASEDERIVQLLSISRYSSAGQLPEIRQGQIWRLFTPMFLHFGVLHLLFNMLWLRDLGSMIEARKGTWMLLLMVLVLAATSNVGEYLASGPRFGGMSGVVFGLLGYVWMQGRYNPTGGLAVHAQTVTMMIVWFFLGVSGVISHIANTAHAVGAIVGIVWGFVAAKLATARR